MKQTRANVANAKPAAVPTRRKKTSANSMWGGRFAAAPSALMEQVNASIAFDKALATQDLAGSRALYHADRGRHRECVGRSRHIEGP